ncbi:protein kinase [Streptomyces sp. NPDC059781]|uniref:serine/threonine-protein kinase n=1 Tax=unclassified Streptomyces TaxID=2593676 RepID=UPI0036470C70
MGQGLIDGRFRVGQVIGKGNMGEVHRAEDLQAPEDSAGRQVAVKTILRRRSGALIDTGADAKSVERFAREVRIMRRLEHPSLTRLVAGGVSEDGGLPYLAMEFLDGETLRDLIEEERQLPISWVAAIGVQIADGLSAAHAADVVHRDLKPANVMLTRGGTVKVLDFGMGRIVDDPDESRLTSTGVSVGTARYMAPEQFEARQVTQAADLYALGCVLYEMLVAVPPFISESPFELARKHLEAEPTPIGVIRSEIPAELIRLVGRLLAKDPADRPANAAEVRDALHPLAVRDGDTSRLPHWSALDPTRHLVAAGARTAASPSEPAAPRPAPVTASGTAMDVFGVHRALIKDYRDFTEGGTVIRDDRVAAFVEKDLDDKAQWPDPWLSLNPVLPERRHSRRTGRGAGAAPGVRPHLPGREDQGRHGPGRPSAHPPPPPARGHRRRRARRELHLHPHPASGPRPPSPQVGLNQRVGGPEAPARQPALALPLYRYPEPSCRHSKRKTPERSRRRCPATHTPMCPCFFRRMQRTTTSSYVSTRSAPSIAAHSWVAAATGCPPSSTATGNVTSPTCPPRRGASGPSVTRPVRTTCTSDMPSPRG